MKKYATTLFIFTIFLIILSSCGGSALQSEQSSGQAEEGDKESIKIGAILPFSGVYTSLGKDLSDGMKLYLDSVDWQAGGKDIELLEEDTEADPQTALRMTRKLMDRENIDILTGAVSTAVAYAIRDEVDANQLPYLASHAGGNNLTREERSDYIWRSSFSSWQIGHAMGQWAYDNVGDQMYVAAADYAFGREVSAAFVEAYEEAGGEIVGEVYPPLENNDYASYLTTIRDADADGVYAFFAGSDAVRFVQQFEEYGLKEELELLGSGWLVSEDLRESIGEAAEGTKAASFWDYNLENDENQEFVQAYEEAYDRRPTVEALEGYDAARIIVETIEALDGDVSDGKQVAEAMGNVTFNSPRGAFSFDKNTHHVLQDMYILETVLEGERTENKLLETIEEVQDPGE
ncbi:amino acid/amide ABC transporter substrate-binding protein, HAAT family [Alteribacillus persepolensis]|uniref:Amino acid/amide ABC transporter substrate-binding protein, HAAT family n=1 Tax=Alteribacillus persepolensis TaxID=568899 RepID=A0A1G8GFN4_9BACI|nr:ABC transporter substrate-binding protein [Alteribacillus persepolensis]SDH93192.1 amino acid/amide ABC transporter substrate-binding protein, HAAT family [Alteribacillus persepolensis]